MQVEVVDDASTDADVASIVNLWQRPDKIFPAEKMSEESAEF